MGRIINIKVIKNHSSKEFESELSLCIYNFEKKGYSCTVVYTPLMQPTGKPLYMAMVEVRE